MNPSTPLNSLSTDSLKVSKKNRNKKPHQTHENSIQAYSEIKKEGLIERQADKAIRMLEINQPITNRGLSAISGIEIGAMCRVLFNAKKAGIVKEAYSDRCDITKKTVSYYTLMNWKGNSDAS
jgi:predicted HTH transcriptional regulator